MRSRVINPEFFKDETLSELSPLHRLTFAGLWCVADKHGRFKWSAKRLKVEIMPYEDCVFSEILADLVAAKLVIVYETEECGLCAYIPNFLKYQKPHPKESSSSIPEPKGSPKVDLGLTQDSSIQPCSLSSCSTSISISNSICRPELSRQIHEIISNKHGTKILFTVWDWTPLDRLKIPDQWVLDLYDAVFNPTAPGWVKKYIGWLEGKNAAKNIINHKAELDGVVDMYSTQGAEYLEKLQREAANDTSTG